MSLANVQHASLQNHAVVQTLPALWLQQLSEQQSVSGIAWLDQARHKATDELAASGRLPGRKDERWKYFSLQKLESAQPELGTGSAAALQPDTALLSDVGGVCLRISVGSALELPDDLLNSLPSGLRLLTLQQAVADPALSGRLADLVMAVDCQGPSRVFEALNTASLDSALVIHVAEGKDAGRVHLEWLQAVANRLDNFRLMVLLEKGAQLQLLETYPASETPNQDSQPVFNLLSQVQLAESAQLDHLRVQSASEQNHLLQFVSVDQASDSQYRYTGFEMGGGLVRNDLNCQLNGKGANTNLAAAFIGNGESCIDYHIIADHQATHCTSEQNFRGVLGGRSKGVFNGKALIRPGADDSIVRQSNANLLLTDLAEMNTKPELEIYADEVEASHGATVGQLDEQALFYLQTRGIDKTDARRMLTGAFCRAIGNRLSDRKLVEQIEALLDAAMPGISEHDEAQS
jgi:Fe-S cluster assembly protein SufD